MTTTGPAALDARPSRRRIMLVAVPWVLAACLAGAGLHWRTSPPRPESSLPAGDPTTPDGAAVSLGAGLPATPSPSGREPVAVQPPLPPATALAVVAAARTALGTAGLGDGTGPHPDRWALDIRVVATEAVTASVAVATVHGLVTDRTARGWSEPVVRAVAVPVAIGGTPGVLGPGWPLPAPTTATVDLGGRPVADPAPALVEPLVEAGWAIGEVTAIDLVAGALLRVRLHGTAPGEAAAAGHEVWLHDAPGGTRLLPAPAVPAAPRHPTAPDPTTPDHPTDRTSTEESP